MTIGELLKEKRLESGKTQRAWIGDIVSPSFYAKVEKNQHRISAEDLIAILDYNGLAIGDFFELLNDEKRIIDNQRNAINRIAINAVYKNDLDKLNSLIEQIKKADWPQEDKEESILLMQGQIESVKDDINQNYVPDQTIAKNLKEKIFNIPNFSLFKLELYTNFMFMYDYKTNIVITKQVIKRIDKTNDDKSFLAIAGIINNIIYQLIENKKFAETEQFFEAAKKPIRISIIFLAKCMIYLSRYIVNYHYSHRQEDLDKAKIIAKTYYLTGLEEVGKSAQEFIDQAKNHF